MKKTYILIAAAIFFGSSARVGAQGFYLQAGLGYAFPEAGQTLDGTATPYNGSVTNNNSGIHAYSIKGASLSSGMHADLGAGYMFTEHVGAELGADIGVATKKYTFNDYNISLQGIPSNASIITQAKVPIILTPSLVLQTGGTINIYSRFGLALPLKTQITQDQVISNQPGTGAIEVDDYTFNVKNSFSLGFAAAAGVRYKLNDNISLWGEISILSLSVYAKESDLTAVTSNGSSVPLSLVSGPQKVIYSKTASVDSNGAQQPTYSQPFSNVGIHVGVTFNLGGGSRSKGRFNHGEADDNKPFRRR